MFYLWKTTWSPCTQDDLSMREWVNCTVQEIKASNDHEKIISQQIKMHSGDRRTRGQLKSLSKVRHARIRQMVREMISSVARARERWFRYFLMRAARCQWNFSRRTHRGSLFWRECRCVRAFSGPRQYFAAHLAAGNDYDAINCPALGWAGGKTHSAV